VWKLLKSLKISRLELTGNTKSPGNQLLPKYLALCYNNAIFDSNVIAGAKLRGSWNTPKRILRLSGVAENDRVILWGDLYG